MIKLYSVSYSGSYENQKMIEPRKKLRMPKIVEIPFKDVMENRRYGCEVTQDILSKKNDPIAVHTLVTFIGEISDRTLPSDFKMAVDQAIIELKLRS